MKFMQFDLILLFQQAIDQSVTPSTVNKYTRVTIDHSRNHIYHFSIHKSQQGLNKVKPPMQTVWVLHNSMVFLMCLSQSFTMVMIFGTINAALNCLHKTMTSQKYPTYNSFVTMWKHYRTLIYIPQYKIRHQLVTTMNPSCTLTEVFGQSAQTTSSSTKNLSVRIQQC